MDAFQFGFFDELQKVAAGLMDAANFGNRPLPKPGTTLRPSTLGQKFRPNYADFKEKIKRQLAAQNSVGYAPKPIRKTAAYELRGANPAVSKAIAAEVRRRMGNSELMLEVPKSKRSRPGYAFFQSRTRIGRNPVGAFDMTEPNDLAAVKHYRKQAFDARKKHFYDIVKERGLRSRPIKVKS